MFKLIDALVVFVIKNPIDLDLAKFVRWDWSSPMKKNAFVRFYRILLRHYIP